VSRFRPSKTVVVLLALIALLSALLWPVQESIDVAREGLVTGQTSAETRLLELGGNAMLGSFKTIAVGLLWYQESELKDRRELMELEGVYRALAKLQPTEIKAYVFLVWNMAYNIQYDAATVVEAWKWVKRAIEFGEKGAERNLNHPGVWELYWQIGWVYSHRCASLDDNRTRYFRQQIEKPVSEGGQGKAPYLVAADWYEKAWNAAIRPGARKVNIRLISQWAHAYAQLANEAEKAGDVDTMIRFREKAIRIHELIINHTENGKIQFPKYEETGRKLSAELRALIRLHKQARKADHLRDTGRTREAAQLRLETAREWLVLFQGMPYSDEYQRNLDRSADALESLAGGIDDAQLRNDTMSTILTLRYEAAVPHRRSDTAARNLQRTLARYDEFLAGLAGPKEFLRNKELVQSIARSWARIIANLPDDPGLAARAEAAIRRSDSLYAGLAPEERSELIENWMMLMASSDIDTPAGRQRIRQAALQRDTALLQLTSGIVRSMEQLGRLFQDGAPPDQWEPVAARAFVAIPAARALAQEAVRYWSALLRRDEPYAADARVAEQHLVRIAEALGETAEIATNVLGQPASSDDGRSPQNLVHPAGAIWRTLHQFAPANNRYLKKSLEHAKKVRRKPRVQAHSHSH